MSVVAAFAQNEYWAAAASAAGLPYGEDAASVSFLQQCPGMRHLTRSLQCANDMRRELNDPYRIPLLVLQNNRDCVVVQSAGTNLRDAHLQVFGDPAHNTQQEARAGQHTCTPALQNDYGCLQTVYTGDGGTRSLVETVFYEGPAATPNPGDMNLGHYWIGGEEGNEGRYAMRVGPGYPDIIWDFSHAIPAPPGAHANRGDVHQRSRVEAMDSLTMQSCESSACHLMRLQHLVRDVDQGIHPGHS